MEIQVKEFTSPQNEWVKWADKQFNEKTYLKEDTAKGEYDIQEDSYGTIQYYKPGTGELHRTDGPAAEWADGSKEWYQNGKLHRTDGPAVEYADGSKVWYENGVKMSEEQFIKKTAPSKEYILAQIERLLGRKVKSIEWAE